MNEEKTEAVRRPQNYQVKQLLEGVFLRQVVDVVSGRVICTCENEKIAWRVAEAFELADAGEDDRRIHWEEF